MLPNSVDILTHQKLTHVVYPAVDLCCFVTGFTVWKLMLDSVDGLSDVFSYSQRLCW